LLAKGDAPDAGTSPFATFGQMRNVPISPVPISAQHPLPLGIKLVRIRAREVLPNV